jgi:glycosyltransferase involved in cell wall biosynthesis
VGMTETQQNRYLLNRSGMSYILIVLKDQLNSIVVASNDDEALANLIEIFMQYPQIMKQMAKEANKQLFLAEEMSKKYDDLYLEMSTLYA